MKATTLVIEFRNSNAPDSDWPPSFELHIIASEEEDRPLYRQEVSIFCSRLMETPLHNTFELLEPIRKKELGADGYSIIMDEEGFFTKIHVCDFPDFSYENIDLIRFSILNDGDEEDTAEREGWPMPPMTLDILVERKLFLEKFKKRIRLGSETLTLFTSYRP